MDEQVKESEVTIESLMGDLQKEREINNQLANDLSAAREMNASLLEKLNKPQQEEPPKTLKELFNDIYERSTKSNGH